MTKQGTVVRLDTGVSWGVSGVAAGLADGEYTVAVRPNYVLPVRSERATVPLRGRVAVTELSGSESSAHFTMGDINWVSLSHGTHPYEVGEEHDFYLDPSHCFYFGADGKLAV